MKNLRNDALLIFQHALKAADPFEAVMREVKVKGSCLTVGDRRYDLKNYRRIFTIGAGKGSAPMAGAIETLLRDRITDGIVVVKDGYSIPARKTLILEAGHPIPDKRGLEAARKIIRLLKQTDEDDLILVLISGGGSALLPAPLKGITLLDQKRVTGLLIGSGATIREINTIRKHISSLHGGRLAKLAYPSTVISLILSDVVGDPVDSIASGPTAPDGTTFKDCIDVLEKYDLMKKTPPPVFRLLKRGCRSRASETPKKDDPAFRRTFNLIVGNNLRCLRAASRKATELGYRTLILSAAIEGETRVVAGMHASFAQEILRSGNPVQSPACIISGGETTVTVKGRGLGGRNQEFVLAAALNFGDTKNIVVLSAGTDGTDGPTDAAGAIADSGTIRRAKHHGMDARQFLDRNDSHRFFKRLNDLVITGPTFTNVMDIRILLAAAENTP